MNLKALFHIAFFLLSFSASTYLFYNNYKTIFPLYIPIIFGLFYFGKGIVKILQKNKFYFINIIIISLLYFQISIKLFYTYYNILISIILIIFTSVFLIKFKNKLQISNKRITLFLLIINYILLLTPNEYILSKLNRITNFGKSWDANITWNDFKGEPINSSPYSAVIYSSMVYKTNKLYNYPPAIIVSKMDINASWKRDSIFDPDDYNKSILLNHEQGHFNITELKTRMARDSINKYWLSRGSIIDSIVNYFSSKNKGAHNVYDEFTNHGQDTIHQKKIDSIILSQLKVFQ